jgi:hypothetical protein
MGNYIVSGKAKVVYAPSVANLAAPTSGEITAGTVLNLPGTHVNAGLIEMTGFETEQSFVTLSDMGTTTDGKIPGRKTLPDASLKFYDDDASATVRTALAEGSSGFIIRFPYGQSTGKRCEVWPVTIGAINDSPYSAANEAQTFMVAVAITSTPNKLAVSP